MALVLGIESSCDEMAAAVVRDGHQILSSAVHHQDSVHAPYGGVVPELASRDHVCHVQSTVEGALAQAGTELDSIDAIGVTSGPGLIGSLLVGLSFAKALAYRTGKPLVAVHHIEGHLASAQLAEEPLETPFIGLVVSGGHTALYRVESFAQIALLGQTRDDAAGEAFDKVAKLLGLGYPGGREVDLAARRGDPAAVTLPRPMLRSNDLAMSFSGLKTAVALKAARADATVEDLCASFQESVVDVLIAKTRRALSQAGLKRLAVVGGLAANSRLRERLRLELEGDRVDVRFPPMALCTDNAAMIAAVADRMLEEGRTAPLELEAFSRIPLVAAQAAGAHP